MSFARSGHAIALTGLLLAILLLPSAARATISHGIKLRWAGDRPLPAQSGQEFVGRFEIVAGASGRVEDLGVSGAGWTLRDMDGPASVFLAKGQRRVVTFRAVPQDPTQPLTIRCVWEGRAIEKSLRLDAASLEKKSRPRPVRFADKRGPSLSGQRTSPRPSAERAAAQQIHFTGDFRYTRWDGQPQGADNIVVRVMDDDSPDPFDEEIWVGGTDPNGHFEATVVWDDCDITGCDDPDIYLEIIAAGPSVDVQEDDLLETTYSWVTPVIDDFTGNEVDFGAMSPTDAIEDGAVHIYNSIVRARRYASIHHDMTPDQVDVLWPDYDDPTSYSSTFEEIHVEPARQWNELSHTHEFGHYLHDVFGNLQEPDYANGYCDPAGEPPSHCLWCPEHPTEGWQEGFANWYGQLVTEDYPAAYGYAPWASLSPGGNANESRYGLEGLGACQEDTLHYPGPETEGYVMALLRDIQDPANDDHDGGSPDCYIDATSLGADEIMTVFKEDDPTNVTAFLDSFRARYPLQYDQDLWSTIQNVAPNLAFPLPDPVVLSQPEPCRLARLGDSVTLQAVGNGSLLQYRWRRDGVNLTNGAGVTGADSSKLTLSPITALMSGVYECVVSTCDGTLSVTSAATRLTIFAAPTTARPHLTWGENYGAQCGNGTNVTELPPGSYTGLTNIVQMDGGRSYSMALRSDGTVYTWGRTENGELGNGVGWSNYVHSPQAINLTNVIQIEAGNTHALALLRDGTVRSWGSNFYGQLGDSTRNDRLTPSPTRFSGCIVALAAGYSHTLALRADGTVLACGNNALSSLGNGTTGGIYPFPSPVPGLTDVVAIAAAGYSSFALRSDGTVWSWGYNAFGELGNGNTTDSAVPVQVSGLSEIRQIAASYYNGYAIRNTGEAYAWGRGDMGAIGDGSAAWRLTPVVIPGLTDPKKIEAGDAGWAIALLQDGTLRAWGYNVNGVLATGAPFGVYRYSHEPVLNVTAANGVDAGFATAHVLGHLVGVTGVETPASEQVPMALALRVAPVPSRASTSLAFDLPSSGRVAIAIYDVSGRLVRSILTEPRVAGRHTTAWDGKTRSGEEAPAGVYFARLTGSGGTATRRIVLVR